jgi:hypothetical protein
MSAQQMRQMIDWAVARAVTYSWDVLLAVAVGCVLYIIASLHVAKIVFPDGVPTYAFFYVGLFGTLAIRACITNRPAVLDRDLAHFKKLMDDGLLNDAQRDVMVERAITWYGNRRYGAHLTAAGESDPEAAPNGD